MEATKENFSFKSLFSSKEFSFINKDIIYDLISELKYEYPSEIQEKIIKDIISENKEKKEIFNKENNVLCSVIKAEAGTGKTLGYLIKLLQSINIPRDNELEGIIITPTRELSLQTEEYLSKIKNLKYKILIGGKANVPGKIKKEKIDKNNIPKIIVGTLGKLREVLLINKKKKWKNYQNSILNNLKCVVIDEADKMMDQNKPPMNLLESFLNYIFQFLFKNNRQNRDIINNSNNNIINLKENTLINEDNDKNTYKQLILCSASFNNKTESFYTNLIIKYINNKKIEFNYFSTSNIEDINNEKLKDEKIVNNNIKEYNIDFYDKKHESFYEQKYRILIILLSSLQNKYNQCLIFYNKKNKGEELSQDLRNYGYSICFIHGELNQDERQLIYTKIKNLDYKIILSTDLLSRGIDLTAVNLVINFDQAFDNIEHNHRVGRTGRFFEKGIVISFFENKNNREIIKQNNVNRYDNNEIRTVIKLVENEFIISERLSKNDIDKINKGKNNNINILNDALTEVNGVNLLLQKKRKIQYEKESLIISDNLNQNSEDNDENEIDNNKNSNIINEKKEIKKKFCLYCDLFKIFDV